MTDPKDTGAAPLPAVGAPVLAFNTGRRADEAAGLWLATEPPFDLEMAAIGRNSAPVPGADRPISIRPGETVTFTGARLIANDVDPDGDPLSISQIFSTTAQGGTVQAIRADTFRYTPPAGFTGSDTFTYVISDGFGGLATTTLTINVVNTAPVAVADTYTLRPGQTLTVPAATGLLANDTDANGDPLTVLSTNVTGTDGIVSAQTTGAFTYTPDAGFVGTDSFTYTIRDGFGGSSTGTVTLNVVNTAPVAVADTYTLLPGQTLTVPAATGLLANDTDANGDALSVLSITPTDLDGTVSVLTGGGFTYTPDPGFSGIDTFTYTIRDGFGGFSTGTVTLNVVNSAPVAVADNYTLLPGQTLTVPAATGLLANDTDANGDPLTVTSINVTGTDGAASALANGGFTYTPDLGFVGTDSFTYTIRDGFGGTGSATVTLHVVSATLVETLFSATSLNLNSSVLLQDAENLTLTGARNINATGNARDNFLTGNAGNNRLNGGVRNDTMLGGAGNDTYVVDAAGDRVFETTTTAGRINAGGIDTVESSITFSLDATVGLRFVENLILTGNGAINGTGNELANRITGNAAVNVLSDGGGAGADELIGALGNDTYIVRNAGTQIVEVAGQGTSDRVAAAVSFVLAEDDDIELLTTTSLAGTDAINLTGNGLAQSITGNAGANTLSDGGGGAADVLIGSLGNDTYIVRNAASQIVESAGQGTADRVAAGVSFVLAADDDIEVLTTTSTGGTGAIDLTGNGLAQTITGNAGLNVLSDGGGAGADVLTGLGGNDTYLVRNAGTQIVEGAGQGTTDRVAAGVSFTLAADDNIEVMTTTSSAAVTLINLTGNDVAQSLTGNAGTNTLDGGGGNDTMIGGLGADSFQFSTALGAGNIDTITDFNVAADTIRLENAFFAGLATGTLTAAALRVSITGLASAAADRIIYDSATGNLYFDADGTGATARVHFAALDAGLALTNLDFLVF